MKENLTKSIEDYLETLYIFELNGEKNIQPLKIANTLNVSKAAVTKAMAKLDEDGYVNKEFYGHISLTDKGREIGSKVYDKHNAIKEFLLNIGVSEETAEIDCCKIEHTISDETLQKIKEFNIKSL